jgi:LysR family glycine cleavage system transcriptional activator
MPYRLPSLNGLRAFEAAARHLSFSKAADELNVTPAALSYQIRTLEEHLGIKLFRRLHRAVVLTEAGNLTFPGIRDAFGRMDDTMARLRRANETMTLHVTVGPAFANKWLAPRFYRFIERHPEIDTRVIAEFSNVDLNHEPIDVALRFGLGDETGVHMEKLLDESLVPMCSPALLTSGPPLRSPEDLRHHTLIHDDSMVGLYDDPPTWATWLEHAKVSGIDSDRGPRFNHADHAIETALEGAGVVLARQVLAAADIRTGRLVVPFDLSLPAGAAFWFACREGEIDRPTIAPFRTWLLDEIARDRGESRLPD